MERFGASAMAALLGFQVYAISHRALDLGLLGLAEAIPGVTLVLHGGHIADRYSRQRIMVVTSALLGMLSLATALLSHTGRSAALLPGLFALAFLTGVIRAYESPAATGLEAQVVPAGGALRGIALLATAARLADVAGPIAVGFAWAIVGPAHSYEVIAGSFLLATAAMMLGVAHRPPETRRGTGAWRDIGEGLRYVFTDQIMIGSMVLDLFAVFFGGATALIPVFATDILHTGPIGFGFLRSALGAGSLVAALLAPRLLPQQRAGLALHAVVGGFGVSMIVFGLSHSLVLSFLALFLAGLCDGVSVIVRRAILRLGSPEALRGRIGAVKSVFVGSSNELGTFESGVAASVLGAGPAVWGGGLFTLAIVALTFWTMPKLRGLNLLALAGPNPPVTPADTLPDEAMPGVPP